MRTKLVCANPTVTILDEALFNVEYTHLINADVDFTPGTAASAQLTFTTTVNTLTKDTMFAYYTWQASDNDWRLMGQFNVKEIKKNGDGYSVLAYDNVIKLDMRIDEWLPFVEDTDLVTLFERLGGHCGAPAANLPLSVNLYYDVSPKGLRGKVTTGRELAAAIAQVAAGACVATPEGRLQVKQYAVVNKAITNANAFEIDVSEDKAPQINKITVQLGRITDNLQNSNRVTVNGMETGETVWFIEYNPIFYGKLATDSNMITAISEMALAVEDLNEYYWGKVVLPEDYGINCGDIITVNGKRFPVMQKVLNENGCTLTSFGDKERATQMTSQETETWLNGRSNDSAVLTQSWMADDKLKVFGSNLELASDLILPNLGYKTIVLPGATYPGNPSNKSLQALLQHILTRLDKLDGAASTTGENLDVFLQSNTLPDRLYWNADVSSAWRSAVPMAYPNKAQFNSFQATALPQFVPDPNQTSGSSDGVKPITYSSGVYTVELSDAANAYLGQYRYNQHLGDFPLRSVYSEQDVKCYRYDAYLTANESASFTLKPLGGEYNSSPEWIQLTYQDGITWRTKTINGTHHWGVTGGWYEYQYDDTYFNIASTVGTVEGPSYGPIRGLIYYQVTIHIVFKNTCIPSGATRGTVYIEAGTSSSVQKSVVAIK